MKLLSILQRGSKKTDTTNHATNVPASSNTGGNSHNGHNISNTLVGRGSSKPQRPSVKSKVQHNNIIHNDPFHHHHRRHESNSSSNNSIFSIPTQGYDDHTIDANTLFEWSVADNAPSVGSIADLFVKDSWRRGPENDSDNHHAPPPPPLTKKEEKANRKPSNKLRNMMTSKKRHGYGSSSDDDDDAIDDEEDNVVLEQHFQYCKLSDSPPRPVNQGHNPNNTSFTSVDNTPVRKGKSNAVMTTEQLHSPSKIQPRQRRNGTNAIPIQALRNVTATHRESGGEERILCAELKGRIHAVKFDAEEENHKDRSYDQSLRSSIGSPSSSVDDASVQNVGNANSPFRHVGADRGRMEDLSMFYSTRNLGDTNVSPGVMYGERVIAPDMEPEFTFSITQEDLFGSDVESTWLLNDGDSSDESTTSNDDNGHVQGNDKMGHKVNSIQERNAKKDYSSRTFATDGAVADDESAYISGNWKSTGSSTASNKSSSSCNHPVVNHKFRSKVRNQVKNKFQSIVKKKNKGQDFSSQSAVASQVEKPHLKRQSSELSMAPLTGIEEHSRLRLVGKSRKDKELAREVERRKEIERRGIARRMKQRKEREEMERIRRQQLMDAEKWKTNTVDTHKPKEGAHYDQTDPLDERSRQMLQTRTHGNAKEGMVGVAQNNIPSKDTSIETQSQQMRAPSTHDEQSSTNTGKSFHTCLTSRIDNTTTMTGFSRHITAVPDFDPYFPDEDSTAQTPEALAPITHDFSCVLCKKGERTHLAVPCMHFSFCGDCVSMLEKQPPGGTIRCTVCNQKADKFSKVFY
jgi:hypothetical protein